MTVAFTLAWWAVPTLITVLATLWAGFWPFEDDWYGFTRLMALPAALAMMTVAWVVAGFLK